MYYIIRLIKKGTGKLYGRTAALHTARAMATEAYDTTGYHHGVFKRIE